MIFKGNYDGKGVLSGIETIRWVKIQAGQDSDQPSGFILESTDGTTITEHYFWMDQSSNFRTSTSKPTDEDGEGSVIAGAANAGANTTLSNLATTALNANLILPDAIAAAFGTSSDYTIQYDGSDLLIDPAAANDLIKIGGTTVSDIQITGAASEVTWDGSADTLTVMDSGKLAFGDADDVTISWDATDLEIDFAAANSAVQFGNTAPSDLVLHGATAGTDVTWDASANTLSFLDDTICAFGDIDDVYFQFASAGTLSLLQTVAGTGSFVIGVDGKGLDVKFYGDTAGDYMLWDESGDTLLFEDATISVAGANVTYTYGISTDELLIDGTDHANCGMTFGTSGTNGLDVTFQSITAGDTIVFDAGAKSLTFTDVNLRMADADEIQFGASGDITFEYDGTGNTLDVKQGADGTGSIDFQDIPLIWTGADSAGSALAITAIDTTGNSDTVTIAHSGSGSGLKITCSEADSVGLEVLTAASQTTSAVVIDGATGNYIGANDVGALHITGDTTHANAGATLLYVANSGKPVAAAEGSVARFLDTGTATASTYAVEINSTNNNSLIVKSGAVGVTPVTISPFAASTASSLVVGGGADWDGADNIGMVHINSDTALIHAGATNLFVGHATAQVITSAEGYLARFIGTGTARAGATAVEISAKDATETGLAVTSGSSTFTHKVTCTAGVQSGGVSVTPTADGTGTGLVADGTRVAVITSGVNANCWMTLPTPTPGTLLTVMCSGDAAGFEVRSSAPATVAINGGSEANAESAIAATATVLEFYCASATEWFATQLDADGDITKVEAAAAA